MFYNYFKIILNNLKPNTARSSEIVRSLRMINQQSHAFTRELQTNLTVSKKRLAEHIPSMNINPFENIGLKNEEPIKLDTKSNSKL
jgi:ABC-type transport system involved in cytochrome bd biosynthesis fused ATPase/permease subunit